jgi:O-antigen/teichoic acid export membrane protein
VILNRAISYSLLFRIWQAGAGLVTIPAVIHFLEPEVQGFYYTFASIVAMQSFFELGVSVVISVYASHEWRHLNLDTEGRVAGERNALSRLASLHHFIFRYFGTVSVLYLVGVGFAGFWILGSGAQVGVNWSGPWILHILFSAGSLWLVPYLSLLEGCNQMAIVSKFRLLQAFLSTICLWVGLASGLGLWALPLYSGIALVLLCVNLVLVRRNFFQSLMQASSGESLSWRRDLLPMQWRLAVQALFGYLSFPLYTVLAYRYFGATEAGRLGMTLQIVSGVQSFSLVFVFARAPEFALLAASGEARALLRAWRGACALALAVMFVSCGAIGFGLWKASELDWPQVMRILPEEMFLILAAGAFLVCIVQCIATYMRAHKRELLTSVGTTSGILYGTLAWVFCVTVGLEGVLASYLAVTALVVLPLTVLIARANFPRLLSRAGEVP